MQFTDCEKIGRAIALTVTGVARKSLLLPPLAREVPFCSPIPLVTASQRLFQELGLLNTRASLSELPHTVNFFPGWETAVYRETVNSFSLPSGPTAFLPLEA